MKQAGEEGSRSAEGGAVTAPPCDPLPSREPPGNHLKPKLGGLVFVVGGGEEVDGPGTSGSKGAAMGKGGVLGAGDAGRGGTLLTHRGLLYGSKE